jgi:MFS family permease
MKGNVMFIFSMLVFITILLVSHTPIEVMALLGLLLVIFLVPAIREGIWKDGYRKIKVAFYTSICFTAGLFIFYFAMSVLKGNSYRVDGELSLFILLVLLFSMGGNFLYGIPVSLMAEYISMKISSMRLWISGLIHIGMGAFTYFIFPGVLPGAMCCAVIFFLIDERMRGNDGG